VDEAGFPAVYMTGFGTSAALIGRPDVGLLTMTEMAGNAGRIAACVDIPVIADADTGYDNPLNVIRTVGAYEAAGVAGIHIEDQVAPKKCGDMEGKQVIGAQEMAEKVRAAVDARAHPEFVIIARTDARAVEAWKPRPSGAGCTATPGPTSCSSRRWCPRRRPRKWPWPSPVSRCCSTGPREARPRRSAWTG
jgi:2-methylisocitrate lyase-like PEP mutase family enzyme